MNFLRTQNYSSDKALGGLIDFTKNSFATDEHEYTEVKKRRNVPKAREDTEFKPKELFCDRDLEYIQENLTSATAILSAFSEEDIEHLDQLEEKRNKLWRKRRQEGEEFAREAERLKRSLPDVEGPEKRRPITENTTNNTPLLKTSLFFKESKTTYTLQPIIALKRKEPQRSTTQDCREQGNHINNSKVTEAGHSTAQEGTAYKATSGVSPTTGTQSTDKSNTKSKLPLIQGYSSSDEDESTVD